MCTTRAIRRWFNVVERGLDRQALHEERTLERGGGGRDRPVTAWGAFARALDLAHELDEGAVLKSIAAPEGLQPDGTACRWELGFDLPARRAKLHVEWWIERDAVRGGFGKARSRGTARPFPPPDGVLALMEREGRVLHRHLVDAWLEERRNQPDLPHAFRDSCAVLEELRGSGMDPARDAVSLATGWDLQGCPAWIASTHGRVVRARFAR